MSVEITPLYDLARRWRRGRDRSIDENGIKTV